MPSAWSASRALHRELDLGTGADQDDLGRDRGAVLRSFGQDVAALGDAGGGAEGVTLGNALAACVGRDVLAGQHDACRVLVVLQHGLPCCGDLVGVAGTDNVQARDGAQGGQLFHRLVGGAVFAQADRVVGPDVQRRNTHERAEADRGTLVVAEDQERAGERPGAAVQRDAVHDRRGGVLADTEVQDPAVRVALPRAGGARGRDERRRTLDGGVVGLGEVGGAAPQFRKDRADRVQDLAGRGAGGDFLACFEHRQGGVELDRKLLGLDALEQCSALGVGGLPCLEGCLPFAALGCAAFDDGAGVRQDVLVNLEGLARGRSPGLPSGLRLPRRRGRNRGSCRCSASWVPGSR